MDKTNYPLLSIIAIVAITAVVAIFLYARGGDGIASPIEAVSGLFSVSVTGQVTAENTREVAPEGNRIDLNDDGELNAADATVLASVIDRAAFCPRNKRCDLNTDGRIDMNDLGLLNGEVLKQQPPTAAPVYVPVSAPISDPALSVGAFGGMA